MTLIRHVIAVASLVALTVAIAGDASRISRYEMSDESAHQWQLPRKLWEISGLALSPGGKLFAVTDEIALVYQLDFESGSLVKTFAFGDPPIEGDFEGIAWQGGKIHLITSDGLLYAAPEMANGERVIPTRVDTGIGEVCEIEGLAAAPGGEDMYIACKGKPKGGNRDYVQVIVWSTSEKKQVRNIELPLTAVQDALRVKHFNPSGITVDGITGNLVIVASRQKSLLELSPDGKFVAARPLTMPDRHRQPEGIELTPDGKLLIADEGSDREARLAIYEPRKIGEE